MKKISIICDLFAVLFVAVSCTDFEDGGRFDSLTVDKTELSSEGYLYPWKENWHRIEVHSGMKWKVSDLPEWVYVYTDNYEYQYKNYNWILNVETTENEGYDRSGSFTISTDSESVTISIFQAGIKGSFVALESLSLNQNDITLTEGRSYILSAIIVPSNASEQNVFWSSSNPSVATVTNGKVLAIKAGSSTITAKVGLLSVQCGVTVRSEYQADGSENGYNWVDLGLPSGLKWATCNLGASQPEEKGTLYAWGEIEPKASFSWSNYKWCRGSSETITKYNHWENYGAVYDNIRQIINDDDVASQQLGGKWRMPSSKEIDELIGNCIINYRNYKGIDGCDVISRMNGNSMFLPFSGVLYKMLDNEAIYRDAAQYWSSTLFQPWSAHTFEFQYNKDNSTGSLQIGMESRYVGLPIRPVIE